jgi:hypothetical protein
MGNRGGGLLHGCRRRWLPILASRRQGGSGSGARATRQRGELNSGATGRSGSPRRLLYGGGRSTGGEQWRGRRLGAMVDGSRCGKVVHGSAVLVAATGSSEGDRGGATWWLDGNRTRQRSGGDRREEERLFTGILGSLYSW